MNKDMAGIDEFEGTIVKVFFFSSFRFFSPRNVIIEVRGHFTFRKGKLLLKFFFTGKQSVFK